MIERVSAQLVLDVLTRARASVAKGWSQFGPASDSGGRPLASEASAEARSWSITGALMLACRYSRLAWHDRAAVVVICRVRDSIIAIERAGIDADIAVGKLADFEQKRLIDQHDRWEKSKPEPHHFVADWNDLEGRRASDVLSVFDHAIAETRNRIAPARRAAVGT